MKDEILLIGGGGHCRACIDVIEAENKLKIGGVVDLPEKLNQKTLGYEVIACDEDLPELVKEYKHFLITIGQITNINKRVEIFEYLKGLGANFPVIISPLAYVSKNARIDVGTIIMHKAFINAGATVGKNCIINTGAIVEHEAKIADHCHISTGSVVNGRSSIGQKTLIGSKSMVANNVEVSADTIIGAGSVVVKSIADHGVYVGNPAKKLR